MKKITSLIIVIILALSGILSLSFFIKTKNVELSVVVIEGDTWKELGEDYGKKCKDQIQGLVALLHEIENAADFFDTSFEKLRDEFEPHIPDYLIDEMKGVAKGANVEYLDILMINAFAEVMMKVSYGDISCTQFAKLDQVGKETGPILGRTLDFFPSFFLANFEVFLVADINGTRWIGHTIAGMIGFLSGMNDDGLVVSVSLVDTDETGDGLPMVLAIRHALQAYKSVAPAASFLYNATHCLGWNFMLIDHNADAAVVEVTHKNNNIRWLGDDDESSDYISATNAFHSDKMSKHGPRSVNSDMRKDRAEDLMKKNDEFGLGDAIEITRDGYDPALEATNPGVNSICRKWIRKTFLPGGTLGSFVALPEQEYVVVSNGYPDSAYWYAINFKGEVVGPVA